MSIDNPRNFPLLEDGTVDVDKLTKEQQKVYDEDWRELLRITSEEMQSEGFRNTVAPMNEEMNGFAKLRKEFGKPGGDTISFQLFPNTPLPPELAEFLVVECGLNFDKEPK